MKYLLFFALTIMSAILPAQNTTAVSMSSSSSTSVSESATNNSYTFKLKVDRKQMKNLVSTYIKLAKITGVSKIVGVSSYTTDEGAVMQMNTKKRTLRIYSDDDQPESLDSAHGLADQVREELNLVPAPAPPKE